MNQPEDPQYRRLRTLVDAIDVRLRDARQTGTAMPARERQALLDQRDAACTAMETIRRSWFGRGDYTHMQEEAR